MPAQRLHGTAARLQARCAPHSRYRQAPQPVVHPAHKPARCTARHSAARDRSAQRAPHDALPVLRIRLHLAPVHARFQHAAAEGVRRRPSRVQVQRTQQRFKYVRQDRGRVLPALPARTAAGGRGCVAVRGHKLGSRCFQRALSSAGTAQVQPHTSCTLSPVRPAAPPRHTARCRALPPSCKAPCPHLRALGSTSR